MVFDYLIILLLADLREILNKYLLIYLRSSIVAQSCYPFIFLPNVMRPSNLGSRALFILFNIYNLYIRKL